MSDLRTAAKELLEALERGESFDRLEDVYAPALRAALEQPTKVIRPEYCTSAAEMEKHILRDEIERLTKALHYEQHLKSRLGTHGPGCWSWGPAHYECALRKVYEEKDE